jgi:Cof subfamily protein (haloacid dehalogenase superfamily)
VSEEREQSDIQAIAVDVDGTLLNSEGVASPRTLNALRRCADAGIMVYVATARPRRLVFRPGEVQGDAPFLTKGGVFYNGAAAFDDTIDAYMHWPMKGSLASDLVSIMETHGHRVQIALQFEDKHHSFRLPMADSDLAHWGFAREDLVPFADARQWDCSKIVAFGEDFDARAVFDEVVLSFSDRVSVFRSDTGRWIQVMSASATKESALQHLLLLRGIEPDGLIVFGDDTPDIGMLRTFKHSVAMGNAPAEAREAAAHVTDSNDEDGIAHALEKYFEL